MYRYMCAVMYVCACMHALLYKCRATGVLQHADDQPCCDKNDAPQSNSVDEHTSKKRPNLLEAVGRLVGHRHPKIARLAAILVDRWDAERLVAEILADIGLEEDAIDRCAHRPRAAETLRAYFNTSGCLWAFIREAFGEGRQPRCHHCDNCVAAAGLATCAGAAGEPAAACGGDGGSPTIALKCAPIVRLLLRAGAQTGLCTLNLGQTALQIAERKGNTECMNAFKEHVAAAVAARRPASR